MEQHLSRSTSSSHNHASKPRRAALASLLAIQQRDAFAQEVITKNIDASSLNDSDRAFATRLVLGVVATQGSLDHVIDRCLRSPHDIKQDVRMALRLSAYEMLYLDKEDHVVVDQGVELVKTIAPRAAGLANAALRKMVSLRKAFPFGDARADLRAAALLEGFPFWLAQRLAKTMDPEHLRLFMEASNEPSPIYIALNPLKGAGDDIREILQAKGGYEEPVLCEGIPVKGCLKVLDRKALADGRLIRSLRDGAALVSDAAAQTVAQICSQTALCILQKKPSPSLLELCAGRGTKTIMIQGDIVRATGHQIKRYVTVDNIAFKNELLKKRAKTYGISIESCLLADLTLRTEPLFPEAFDVVFLDAPCSGLGTMRKHPEIRWRITDQAIEEDAKRDHRLLEAAAVNVAKAGYLIYATCTVIPEENELAVRAFLESDAGRGFRLVPLGEKPIFKSILRPGGPDAHFCAVMKRQDQ